MKQMKYREYRKDVEELRKKLLEAAGEVSENETEAFMWANRVVVFTDWDYYGEAKVTAKVNWSAIGSTSAEDTRKMAKLLMAAADLAEEFEREHEGVEVTFGED